MTDKYIPRSIMGSKPPRYRQNQAKREWNDRFWIESIPSYNPLQDRHCGNYQAMVSKRKKVVIGPGRIRPTKY